MIVSLLTRLVLSGAAPCPSRLAEIHAKLVAIMRERLQVHCKRLPSVAAAWVAQGREGAEDAEAAAAVEPSDFAKALSKEVGTLRRVIVSFLSPTDRRDIFGKVLDLFDAQLAEAFARVEKSAGTGAGRAGGASEDGEGGGPGEANGGHGTRQTAAHIRVDGAL